MRTINRKLVVIGGGPGGLAAAWAARKQGVEDILIIEREDRLGGILNQCIHNGFGLHYFKEELTGPEYAGRFIEMINESPIEYWLNTMAIDINRNKVITVISNLGTTVIKAEAVVLAMGCRERSKGSLNLGGSRPSGIFTAGTAQRYVNIEGYLPGNEIVILGSGDIGLIMARRMTLEGARVKAVLEIMPYSSGLKRNIVQCLEDFDIPLRLCHTITKVHGSARLEGVTVCRVDESRKPIEESAEYIPCDTLLLSVGLIPENELSKGAQIEMSWTTGGPIVDSQMESSVEGIFCCGNVVHVHDLVDNVTKEGIIAGKGVCSYLREKRGRVCAVDIRTGRGLRYTVPNKMSMKDDRVNIYFRVDRIYNSAKIRITQGDRILKEIKRPILTPGEMESVTLSQRDLVNNEESIKVEVV